MTEIVFRVISRVICDIPETINLLGKEVPFSFRDIDDRSNYVEYTTTVSPEGCLPDDPLNMIHLEVSADGYGHVVGGGYIRIDGKYVNAGDFVFDRKGSPSEVNDLLQQAAERLNGWVRKSMG